MFLYETSRPRPRHCRLASSLTMPLSLPGLVGPSSFARVRDVQLLLLSAHREPAAIKEIKSGALDCLKQTPYSDAPDDLQAQIGKISQGPTLQNKL